MRDALYRWLPLPILCVGILVTGALWRGRGVAPDALPPPALPQVDVAIARPTSLRATVRSHGRIEPRGEIQIVAEVGGRLLRVSPNLERGRFFEAGELLVEIDPRDSRVALDAAGGALARAESEALLAEARLGRLLALSEREVVSSASLEEAQHTRDIARASVREAAAARAAAAHDLERCTLRAPYGGRVRERLVEPGQFVTPGTALARIYGIDEAEIRLPILTSELAVLDLASAGGDEQPLQATLRGEHAGRAVSWSARVTGSAGEILPGTRTVHLIARVRDPFARGELSLEGVRSAAAAPPLAVGQWLTAEIAGRRLDGVFALPRAALQGPAEVWVVDASERLEVRAVEVVRTEGEEVWVRQGLAAGERVVVAAGAPLPGERVRVRELSDVAQLAATPGGAE